MPVFLHIYGQLKVMFWIFFHKKLVQRKTPPPPPCRYRWDKILTFYMTLRWGAHLSFPQFFIVGKSLRVQITCKCVGALAFRICLCLEATHIKDSHHCKIIVEKEYCVVMTRTSLIVFVKIDCSQRDHSGTFHIGILFVQLRVLTKCFLGRLGL